MLSSKLYVLIIKHIRLKKCEKNIFKLTKYGKYEFGNEGNL